MKITQAYKIRSSASLRNTICHYLQYQFSKNIRSALDSRIPTTVQFIIEGDASFGNAHFNFLTGAILVALHLYKFSKKHS